MICKRDGEGNLTIDEIHTVLHEVEVRHGETIARTADRRRETANEEGSVVGTDTRGIMIAMTMGEHVINASGLSREG